MYSSLILQYTGYISGLIVRFTLSHKDQLSHGWAPRILVQCGVPFKEVWDVLHEMYESQVHSPLCHRVHCLTVSAGTAFQRPNQCTGHIL